MAGPRNFIDCMRSAREQGVISAAEADELIRRYREHLQAQAAAGTLDATQAAKNALAAELKADAARRRELARLAEAKRGELVEYISEFRGTDGRGDIYEASMRLLENFGFAGTSSVAGRAKAIVSLIHGELADVLRRFERNFLTGMRHQTVAAENVVREMLGQATGSAEARAFADGIAQAFEALRLRFNAAGGAIAKIEGGYIPQFHDPAAVLNAGYQRWHDFIAPLLDRGRMRDPATGGPLSAQRFEESLQAAYEHIVTGGWSERSPSAQQYSRGALANQRQEHRFFTFRDADAWLAYDREFGHGDPLKAIFGHVNGMARDIAALEVLGPNPNSTVDWLINYVQSEHAKALLGQQSLFRMTGAHIASEQSQGTVASAKIAALWEFTRGRQVVNQRIADFAGNVRNVLTSAQLGSASITAAFTDPVLERSARMALGMSQGQMFGSNLKVYLDAVAHYFEHAPIARVVSDVIHAMTGAPREQALRSGMIVEDYLHILGDEARFAGTLGGAVWSRWLADRTINLFGLAPLTNARRAVFQRDLQAHFADNAGLAFDELDGVFRNKLEGYGFDAASWDALRATPQYRASPRSAGFIQPVDVAAANRELAERYTEMILGETERAIPSGTLRSRAYVQSAGGRYGGKGELIHEIQQSFLQYKTFGLSLMTLQMEAIAQESAVAGRAAGASYAAQLFILTTLAGAATIQFKAIANGKDPQKMADPRFVAAAIATGGGLGLAGDLLFQDMSRYGYKAYEPIVGPSLGAFADVAKFLGEDSWRALRGKETHVGRHAVELAGKYTPFLSSGWPVRAAYRRAVLDQLQYQVDPQALRQWREMQLREMRERGRGFYWAPGELAPGRLPDLSRAVQ